MSSWISAADADIMDQFLPDYFQTRRSFHIRHGVFRSKLGKIGEQDIFQVLDWYKNYSPQLEET
jgi:hypothetical protein